MTTLDNGIEDSISRGIILLITVVAFSLLALNVVLISCYVRRKAQKRNNGKFSLYFQILFICRPRGRLKPLMQPRLRLWLELLWLSFCCFFSMRFWFCFVTFVEKQVKVPRPLCPPVEKPLRPQRQRVKWNGKDYGGGFFFRFTVCYLSKISSEVKIDLEYSKIH